LDDAKNIMIEECCLRACWCFLHDITCCKATTCCCTVPTWHGLNVQLHTKAANRHSGVWPSKFLLLVCSSLMGDSTVWLLAHGSVSFADVIECHLSLAFHVLLWACWEKIVY
jgi:hypothetical protein